eukprot:5901782-Pleurochrysis_carterae.AAC.1
MGWKLKICIFSVDCRAGALGNYARCVQIEFTALPPVAGGTNYQKCELHVGQEYDCHPRHELCPSIRCFQPAWTTHLAADSTYLCHRPCRSH